MDILIKNIGYLSKECNECLRTYIAMNDGDENLIGSLRVDCKSGSVDCPLVALPEHGRLISDTDVKALLRSGLSLDSDFDIDYVCGLIDGLQTIVEASNE